MKPAKSSTAACSVLWLLIFILYFGHINTAIAANEVTVSLITDAAPGTAAQHGLNKLISALNDKHIIVERTTSLKQGHGDILIVAGLAAGDSENANLHKSLNIPAPAGPESLLIRKTAWKNKKLILASGADDRGLMYALLDIADRISWADDSKNLLMYVHNIMEKPDVVERALSKYTMHPGNFESYFFDEDYWAAYLDMLAKNRFNTFALLFGYENQGYFTPPYPYFFDVDGFREVHVVGISSQKQRRNLRMLNRVIEMTHQRGMDFTIGIWDHIYRDISEPTEGIVWGLTGENLVPYSKAALGKFLQLVPGIDAVQCRMHGESGLKRNEMKKFWENIYQVILDNRPDIRFDARAKNFPDSLIDKALDMGVNIRICTKYWAEQMGLPFHPTHIPPQNQFDRRHGYADLLRYPQRYQMHYRLWNCGTTRILLWGDPDYARRFADSSHLYNGQGFEVCEPLVTKMWYHPHDLQPFELLSPKYQYYDWEFERYWYFFMLFGRLGYNPETPSDVWQIQFQKRFGAAASYLEQALNSASRVLPRIVAYCFPYDLRFHTTGGWVEKQRREDLPEYAAAGTSDTQQFLSIEDAAVNNIQSRESPKIQPRQSSLWFAQVSKDVLDLVDKAQNKIGPNQNKEFFSTCVDLKILANLALYHSRRVHAGLSWASFKLTNDLNALDDAIVHESSAIRAWEKIIEAAADVYNDNLMMGAPQYNVHGHWKDELIDLKKGLKKLQRQRQNYQPPAGRDKPFIAHVPIRRITPGSNLVIKATINSKNTLTIIQLAYGKTNQDYSYIPMELSKPFIYSAAIPGSMITADFNYFIEAVDQKNHSSTWPTKGSTKPIEVVVTNDNEPPILMHKPIPAAQPNQPLTITAQVHDKSGLKWVRLRYRSVTQFQDYKTMTMQPAGSKHLYQAVVGAEHLDPKWDFMYLFEVMDKKGNGKIYPDLENQTPYIVVQLHSQE